MHTRKSSSGLARVLILAAILTFALLSLAVGGYALTPSGARISASSIADYNNTTGARMPTVTSNIATVTVTQIGGVQLSPSESSINAMPGSTSYAPVSIQNAGNGADSFSIAVTGDAAWSPQVLADTNGDGVHQSTETTVVTNTPSMAAGQSYKCFVAVSAPAGATIPESFTLTVRSTFDSTKTASGTYAVTPITAPPSAYITEWLLNGYYSNSDSSTRLSRDYLAGEADTAPRAGRIQGGKVWTRQTVQGNILDFLGVYGSAAKNCATYACAYLYTPTAVSAELWMGSDDGLKVWLNGRNVWTKDVNRAFVDGQDKVGVQLLAGWNRLLTKVSQATRNWKLSVKVCDSNGSPIPGLTASTDPDGAPPAITIVTVTNVTANSAVVNWTTDAPTTGSILYGQTSALGATVIDTTLNTDHSLTLGGLSAGAKYYFAIEAKDVADNIVRAETATFDTPALPPTTTAYIRKWLLNGYYSNSDGATRLTRDYIGGEACMAPKIGQINGSKPWTYFESATDKLDFVKVYGSRANCATYACAYVYSPIEQDAQLWTGSDDGIKVWFNGTTILTKDVSRSCAPDQDKTAIHLLQGWNRIFAKVSQGSSNWALVAKVCDSDGKSLPGVISDVGAGDSTAPIITDLKVAGDGGNRLAITWTTNEPAMSQIDYGTTSLTSTTRKGALVKDHAVLLSGLTPNTKYIYRVTSADVFGNLSMDDGNIATTTGNQPAPYVEQWLTNGFYFNSNRSNRMATDHLGGESTIEPTIGAVDGRYQWRSVDSGSNGYTDLGDFHGMPVEGLGYVAVYVYSPARQGCELRIGSDDGVKAYLNGKLVWINDVYRSWRADDDTINVTLEAEWNLLLLKITQGIGAWGVSARFCDWDGYSLPGLQYTIGN